MATDLLKTNDLPTNIKRQPWKSLPRKKANLDQVDWLFKPSFERGRIVLASPRPPSPPQPGSAGEVNRDIVFDTEGTTQQSK